MATLRDIRLRIKGVKNTVKITQAMKMVSASKLRRAQEAIESARPYFNKFDELVSNLIANVGDSYTNPILENHKEVKNIGIIVVASDRGLCGSFNSNLLKFANNFIKDELKTQFPGANFHFVAVGKKSVSYYNKDAYSMPNSFPGVFAALKFETAVEIVDSMKSKFNSGEVDLVYVLGNKFVNLVRQIPNAKQLFPLVPSVKIDEVASKFKLDYVYEPGVAAILDDLLPKLVNLTVWRALLDSNAAEQAARMMSMDNASRNANELIGVLNLQYNSKRQAAITTEMLEIVGGAEALTKA